MDAALLPPMGYKILKLTYQTLQKEAIQTDLQHQNNTFENEYLQVSINSQGHIDVYDKVNQKLSRCSLFHRKWR